MKKIEVFGTGCKKCVATEAIIQTKADELGVPIDMVKVTDPVAIASKGIMTTPAVMVDGKIVHKGGLPSDDDVARWLK